MKIHRFIGEYNFKGKDVTISDPATINQIRNVLKLKVGETIILADGIGESAEVSITTMTKDKITGIISKLTRSKENKRKVHLYLAILKKENFELAVQKAVEAGVFAITPVITERTIKTGLNMERLEKIIKEAAEQCGRDFAPKLYEIENYKNALDRALDFKQKVIFHLIDEPYKINKKAESIAIFIGPEGGYTEKEIKMAKDLGYSIASLGALTLRGETAAIIATYRAVQGI